MKTRVRSLLLLLLVVLLAACAGVLGYKSKTKQQTTFPHHAHVVKGIRCTKCHAGIETAGDTGALHIPGKDFCVTCHSSPHHAEQDCAECHGSKWTTASAAAARDKLTFTHKNHMPRVKGDCMQCHQGVRTDAETIRPPMALCLGCHAHRDMYVEKKCDGCHVDLKNEKVMPASHLAHDGDWLREHGTRAAGASDLCSTCHTQSTCAKCHGVTTAALSEKMAFDDPTRLGAHRAGFFSRHSMEARTQPGLCQTCHQPKTCDRCHADRGLTFGKATKSPHPKGWLGLKGTPNDHGRAAWLDPAECASCHSGAGQALCIGCHKVGGPGGNPHTPSFSSKLNKTTDQPCRLCHGASP